MREVARPIAVTFLKQRTDGEAEDGQREQCIKGYIGKAKSESAMAIRMANMKGRRDNMMKMKCYLSQTPVNAKSRSRVSTAVEATNVKE
jgi:hypothetical protein